jgi:hypothetical protein
MHYPKVIWSVLPLLGLLAGCATPVEGPSVMALPGTGHSFDQFRADDSSCRAFAYDQVGGASPNEAAAGTAVAGAVAGTALGAAVGAIANGGQGASVGAATGLALGGLSGASYGMRSAHIVQRRYDNAYVQCMYSKGNRVPVRGNVVGQTNTGPRGSYRGSSPVVDDYAGAPLRGEPPPDAYDY